MLRFLFIISFVLSFTLAGYSQKRGQALVDSLLAELPKQKEDTNKAKLLRTISKDYWDINFDEAIKYGKEGLGLAEKLGWKTGQAKALNSLGFVYQMGSEHTKSVSCFLKALKINEEVGNKRGIASNLGNLGASYSLLGNYPKALESLHSCQKITAELHDTSGTANTSNGIGSIYLKMSNYTQALPYFFKALKGFESIASKGGIAVSLANIGRVYQKQANYPDAIEYLSKALSIFKEIGNKGGIGGFTLEIGLTYSLQKNYPEALKYYAEAMLIARETDNEHLMARSNGGLGNMYLQSAIAIKGAGILSYQAELKKAERYLNEAVIQFRKLDLLDDLHSAYASLAEAYKLSGNYKAALEAHEQYLLYKDSVFNKANTEKITRLEVTAEFEKVQLADSLKNAEAKKQATAKLQRQRNYTYAGVGGILLLLGFSFFIVKERKKSDRLLLNILPSEVAKELKQKGESDAKLFDDVTVLFTDFVGFTTVSEQLTPKQLVDELHTCFTAFDGIMAKYKIEKIKTVGDAYLAVSGLPLADDKHGENVLNAAIEIRDFMLLRKQELGDIGFNIRIGVHSGNVVAGIVGVKKFAYDIWGDTVNTAARMEQKSEAGKINISETTYNLVKDKYTCTYRGEIEAKNKGMMKMYFVEGVSA